MAERPPESVQPEPFQQRWPWIGPDLQTVRDTLRPGPAQAERGAPLVLPLPQGGALLALAEAPAGPPPRAWVLLVHGLGGDSGRPGVRRLARLLLAAGFGVWRLNLRGAGPGRELATGTYAAACNSDLLPVLAQLRQQAAGRPLAAVGLSLGGTVLLNALLAQLQGLDAVACVSSPLDLAASSRRIDAPRNRLYRRVLLAGLIRQTLADAAAPQQLPPLDTIRAFDAAVTAPRWGHASVEHYYAAASPLEPLLAAAGDQALPPLLILHAADDPWVPAAAAQELARQRAGNGAGLRVLLTDRGGHNGFHGCRDRQGPSPAASWADRWVAHWLLEQLG